MTTWTAYARHFETGTYRRARGRFATPEAARAAAEALVPPANWEWDEPYDPASIGGYQGWEMDVKHKKRGDLTACDEQGEWELTARPHND